MAKSDTHKAHLFRRLTWEEIDSDYLRQLINLARLEDLQGQGLSTRPSNTGDATTDSLTIEGEGQADLVARTPLTLCGAQLVENVLHVYGQGCAFSGQHFDGDTLQPGDSIGTISGPIQILLQAERVILNFLQHLCGIASQTKLYSNQLGKSTTRLLDTRKTTPGFRMLEKYAVACGGGWNHRLGLFDRIMLKDNHLASSGATAGERLARAVSQAREKNPQLAIEVEVDALSQIPPVLEAEADVIMLDNFSIENTKTAIKLIGDHAYTEASGGITLDSLAELGDLGLDFISCGALVHQSQWKDIGMDWKA